MGLPSVSNYSSGNVKRASALPLAVWKRCAVADRRRQKS
jgi:hypothetical protein